MKKLTASMIVSILLFLVLDVARAAALSVTDGPGTPVIDHGPRNSTMVALTFDACPTKHADEYDEKVVDVLLREHVPATLFLSGRWVEKNPEKTKFLANHPQFEIEAHTYYHPHLLEKTDERVLREFKRTQAIIKKTTGRTPKYYRPPFGEVDERVASIAKSVGLTTILYDIPSGDPDPGLSPQRIVRVVMREAKGGSIIVFHMNRNGVHTAEILPEVIQKLRQKGFMLVTVGEMLKKTKSGRETTGTLSHGQKPRI
jgi:peptidoglycan/xylan/chitin deacetylase (PgdA/CDA1 family)